ncbi:MAG: hypothetical protein JWP57_3373 [Spirosoma sp.]|nr:hypothetical protein [Spirosoma sp.]
MSRESIIKPGQGLLRFMLYTDVNRRRATQLGPDLWVEAELIYGDTYNYNTEHELTFDEFDNQPGRYVVAMLPHLEWTAHPSQAEGTVSLRIVYLTTVALWPFFELLTLDDLNLSLLAE